MWLVLIPSLLALGMAVELWLKGAHPALVFCFLAGSACVIALFAGHLAS